MKDIQNNRIDNIENLIKDYEIKQKKDKREKMILIIIIVILFLLLLVNFRLGKIGYNPNDNYCQNPINSEIDTGKEIDMNIDENSQKESEQSQEENVKTTYQEEKSQTQTSKIEKIIIKDNQGEIKLNSKLDIFSNIKYDNKAIIAPDSYGKYQFAIINDNNSKIKYSLKFSDKMTNKINMKYRLKLDNSYLKGNKDKYVSINELNIKDLIVLENSNNLFTLEWYWEDDNKNDTYVGSKKEEQSYTLNIEINAEEYNAN